MSDSKFMTQRQYAKHRNASLSSVIDALSSGRITNTLTPKGLKRLDWKKCDEDWAKNTDLGRATNTKQKTKETKETKKDSKIPVFADSRALKEAFNARIKKLEFEERNTMLVKKTVVQRAVENIAYSVKEQLRTIPQKMSAELAAETDSRIIEIKLMKQIDQSLQSLQSLKDAL